ncbi:MAG TPA: M48 family metallopeptidase [Limnochordales bacterium]|nr:M48 family metallopeptidase [Limnochordales bacterium]
MRRKFLMWVSLAVGLWAGSWAGAWMAPWAHGGAAFWMAPGSSAAWAASASARPEHPLLLAGTAAEADWGQQLHQELLAGAGPGPAVEDARAQAIFARVAAVAGAVRDNIPYTLTVLEGEEPAAFALPGGFVYVTTGLVEALDDGQLAGVLAHELVHTVYSHSLLQLSVVASLEQLGATLAAGSDDTVALLADIGTLLLSLGYSRSQEAEADRVGQQWAAAAGFHPLGLAQALRVLDGEAAGGRWLAYLSTHPPTRQRIAALEGAAAAEAAAPGGTGAPAGRPAPAAAGSRWIALLTLLAAALVQGLLLGS